MALYVPRPVANGLRTDHPIPGLPFVDDSHLPLEDPRAIEAIGRRHAEGYNGWGRTDQCRTGGWIACTTEQARTDLAWMVRFHPEHGRSVFLVRNSDTSATHSAMAHEAQDALLFRSGGYFWDGSAWYRPAQMWDMPAERYFRRRVPAAVTVTAGDLLQNGGDPAQAAVLSVHEVDLDAPQAKNWRNHLALWAASRDDRGLGDCVVQLAAPELTGDQLIGIPAMAQIAEISASTLRAYISRKEGDVPAPQAVISNRSVWARPVVEEWAEQRRRSHEGLAEAVAGEHDGHTLPIGLAEIWNRFSQTFFSSLWERPDWRKRWAVRWRTQTAVRAIAEDLSWTVTADLQNLIPMYDLAATLEHALVDELASGLDLTTRNGEPIDWHTPEPDSSLTPADYRTLGITPPITRMLDWLIRHDPNAAASAITGAIGAAEDRLELPRQVCENTIGEALRFDGTLDKDTLNDFLQRIFTPSDSESRTP